MDKLILTSILFVTVALPALAARARSPRRGAVLVLAGLLAFTALYAVLITRVYARLYVPEWFR